MATTPKALKLQQIATTDLTTIYAAPAGSNASISVLSFTNATNTNMQLSIYINDGATDFLQKTMSLPSGAGKERLYYGFQRKIINGGYSIKIQSSSASAFNVGVHGREVEVGGS